jgi:hypothetical protein
MTPTFDATTLSSAELLAEEVRVCRILTRLDTEETAAVQGYLDTMKSITADRRRNRDRLNALRAERLARATIDGEATVRPVDAISASEGTSTPDNLLDGAEGAGVKA